MFVRVIPGCTTASFTFESLKSSNIENIKKRFGLRNESRFTGYFSPQNPWKSDGKVLVSGYTDNGKLMLIVFNLSLNKKVKINFDGKKLNALGIKMPPILFNAENGNSVIPRHNQISLDLEHNDYMILTTEK